MPTAESLPEPLIEIAIEPRSAGDRERLISALSKLVQHDPGLHFTFDPESGQTVLKGADEPHLEIAVDRIKRELQIDATVGPPQVAYRETITRPAEVDYIHRKQTGGSGEFARVKVRLEPLPPGSGFIFENDASGTLPEEFVSGIERGLRVACDHGVIAAFPMIDLKAILIEGAHHEVDSSERTFEIAAGAAFKQVAVQAAPVLLEPIMRLEVVTPDHYMGDVIGDLNSRRGLIIGNDTRGEARVIDATVPLANLFGYFRTLRSISRGQAQHTMQFDHYAIVPHEPPPDRFPPAMGMRQ